MIIIYFDSWKLFPFHVSKFQIPTTKKNDWCSTTAQTKTMKPDNMTWQLKNFGIHFWCEYSNLVQRLVVGEVWFVSRERRVPLINIPFISITQPAKPSQASPTTPFSYLSNIFQVPLSLSFFNIIFHCYSIWCHARLVAENILDL